MQRCENAWCHSDVIFIALRQRSHSKQLLLQCIFSLTKKKSHRKAGLRWVFGFSRMDCIRIESNIWGEKTKIVWNLNSFEIMIATDLFINGWRLTSLQIFDKNSLRWIVDLYRTWMKYEIGSTLIKNMFGTHTKRDRIIIGFIVA